MTSSGDAPHILKIVCLIALSHTSLINSFTSASGSWLVSQQRQSYRQAGTRLSEQHRGDIANSGARAVVAQVLHPKQSRYIS